MRRAVAAGHAAAAAVLLRMWTPTPRYPSGCLCVVAGVIIATSSQSSLKREDDTGAWLNDQRVRALLEHSSSALSCKLSHWHSYAELQGRVRRLGITVND